MSDREQSHEELLTVLQQLDDDDLAALTEMINDSPDLLRQALNEYGYLKGSDTGADDNEFLVNGEPEPLSVAQRELAVHLDGQLETPQTVGEILELVGSEDAAFRQQYSSAQYRSWLSTQLNALVEAGEIGRFRDGRKVQYTETPALAVRHWVRLNSRFIEDLEVVDAVDIKNDTGMPPLIVKDAIREITND